MGCNGYRHVCRVCGNYRALRLDALLDVLRDRGLTMKTICTHLTYRANSLLEMLVDDWHGATWKMPVFLGIFCYSYSGIVKVLDNMPENETVYILIHSCCMSHYYDKTLAWQKYAEINQQSDDKDAKLYRVTCDKIRETYGRNYSVSRY